jgi:hypothetical protein
MPINSLGQYSAGHKVWDHVGNIIPDVEHSEGERPAAEFKPAAWLPVQFYDKYYEDWNVVMPGKIVACDNDGRLCPAQYGLAGASITYTQNDVDAKVVDVRTGLPLLVGAIGTFAVAAVVDFMGRVGVAMAVSLPLGVAPYAYLRWAGGDGFNPAELLDHNYIRQHQVAVLCDYVLQLPLVPASQAAEAVTFGAVVANKSDNTGDPLANLPVATNTPRTPMVFTGGASATLFLNQVSSLALVTSPGDWYINKTTGIITVYATVMPAGISVAYYHYASAPAAVSKFASAVGNLHCGDLVKCDANSNFTLADGTVTDGAGDGWAVMGQVIAHDSGFPKDALERVRTAYNPALATSGAGGLPGSLGQLDQMPGSANGGMPANIAYAGAADTLVLINLISR